MIVNFLNIKGINKQTREEIKNIMEKALERVNQTAEFEINVGFVTPEEIQNVNKKERNKDSATDVLSFPAFNLKVGEIVDINDEKYFLNIDPETKAFALGDMIICTEVARAQAKSYGHSLKTELVRLALHSVLHCLGYDHIKDSDYLLMHKIEMQVMQENGYKVIE